ncbi:MAG: hypothetical protein ABIE14_02905 [Patescibacteria group bacterium]
MKDFYQIIKEIALLIAGALVGIIFIPYENEIFKSLGLIIGVIAVLILFGIGITEHICNFWVFLCRKMNNRKNRIYFYAPYEINGNNSSWVDLSLCQITKYLKDNGTACVRGKKEKLIFRYPITINPYGGTYPEKNISQLQTLNNIFDYVCKGGIYVNIADIPFYYAYDENLQRRVDTTPLAGNFSQVRSFLQTILTTKLHCFVFSLTSGDDFNNGITRIISLQENSKNFFDRDILIGNNQEKFTPQLAIPYGKGYFVFSTILINKDNLNLLNVLLNRTLKLS